MNWFVQFSNRPHYSGQLFLLSTIRFDMEEYCGFDHHYCNADLSHYVYTTRVCLQNIQYPTKNQDEKIAPIISS